VIAPGFVPYLPLRGPSVSPAGGAADRLRHEGPRWVGRARSTFPHRRQSGVAFGRAEPIRLVPGGCMFAPVEELLS
jgi:hypothetical protein